jgi:carboxypeptidase Q
LRRMQDRGERIELHLCMEAQSFPDVVSRNIIAEIKGTEFPDEVVLFGAHIDAWDVGQGAHDDGGNCIASWYALRLLKQLELRPKRTIRMVHWTNEENGLRGAQAYADRYPANKHIVAIEADAGSFAPLGYGFTGSDSAFAIVQAVGGLLSSIGASAVTKGGGGADIGVLMRQGVPGMGLRVAGDKYFWYHHAHADTVDKVDPHELNLCIATLAVMVYVLADLPMPLPR